jgi:hypothetical protein
MSQPVRRCRAPSEPPRVGGIGRDAIGVVAINELSCYPRQTVGAGVRRGGPLARTERASGPSELKRRYSAFG